MDQIRITHMVPARLQALGLDPDTLLRHAHIPRSLWNSERIVVSTAQWFAFWNAMETCTDDPMLGLKLPGTVLGGPYDPVAITALSARTFHEALTKVAQYKRLFCSETMHIVQQDRVWSIDVVWNAAQEPAPRLLIDAMFSSFLELGQRGTGQVIYPQRVLLRREPLYQTMYEAYFHCPVTFDADCNRMIYHAEAMEQPFVTRNPDLLTLLEPSLATDLQHLLAPQRFSEEVKLMLRSRLAGHQPSIQTIACELAMSVRTLQRRLAEEEVQFQQLLETVRRELAQQYLQSSSLDVREIAYLLGYREPSSFHRAFHHWEGISPAQWRAARRLTSAT